MKGYRAVRLLSGAEHKMDNITIDGVYGVYKVDGLIISSHYEGFSPYGNITVRNVYCTVDGNPGRSDNPRSSLFWVEGRASVDSLLIDGCRYTASPSNGKFLFAQGSVKRLYLSNIEIGIEADTPQHGQGALNCVGRSGVGVGETFLNNFSIHADDGGRFEIGFKGSWGAIHAGNASIDTELMRD